MDNSFINGSPLEWLCENYLKHVLWKQKVTQEDGGLKTFSEYVYVRIMQPNTELKRSKFRYTRGQENGS